jgi:hypothetical protein
MTGVHVDLVAVAVAVDVGMCPAMTIRTTGGVAAATDVLVNLSRPHAKVFG